MHTTSGRWRLGLGLALTTASAALLVGGSMTTALGARSAGGRVQAAG